MASGMRIFVLGVLFVAVAVSVFFVIGVVNRDFQLNEVVLEVTYGGSFNVTIIENGVTTTSTTYGLVKTTLVRIGGDKWTIEVNVRKMDSDSGTLYVYLKSSDGEILASDSTCEPFGVATVFLML
jgi:hypothetical protein